ncbi:MAG TPA: hypothetical protein VFA97_09365 [Gaiellaceae bacterium]|nr:hypothetical protein [Gaiellaceae bacterium]
MLRPSPRVPTMPWSAAGSYWRAKPPTIAVLVLGLLLFGCGEGAIIAAKLGNTPWTVLAQGVAKHTPLDIGGATIVISVCVLIGWIPLRQRPGLGTISNVVLIGLSLDIASRVAPEPSATAWRIAQVATGIALVGTGSALYLTANLGPGPRDGWMTGIHRVTGIGIAVVRTSIEITVLVIGFALGGHVGYATLAFALLVGYALAGTLRLMSMLFASVVAAPALTPD